MNGRVAILGGASLTYPDGALHLSLQELTFAGAKAALDTVGISRDDIDEVVISGHDMIDGRGISNMVGAAPAGAYLKSETRTPNDGLYALLLAVNSILSGKSELVLVVAWAKPSEGFDDGVTKTEFDPFYHQPLGMSALSALGLQATAVLTRYGDGAREAATRAVERDLQHGSVRSPAARGNDPLDGGDKDDIVSWPLTRFDLGPLSDGVCALVLANERLAGLATEPAWVRGMGWATDGVALGERDLTVSTSLERARTSALRSAGADVARSVDVVEYSAISSFQHVVVVEGLGLCEPGQGAEWLLDVPGAPLLNPSGGLAWSNSLIATSLMHTLSAVELVRAGATLALVHGSSGPCGQSNAIAVLGREPV